MKILQFLLELLRRLFGASSEKPKAELPESKKPTKPPVEEEVPQAPDEPPEEVDDPDYDVENETPDDHTPRESLPEPEEDTLRAIDEAMVAQSSWKDRQQWLEDLGFDPGPVDGKPGRKTQAALREFQKSRGLEADGVWGPKTQRTMAAALQVAGKPVPPSFVPPPPGMARPKYQNMLGDVELDDEFWASFVDLTAKSNVKDGKGRRRRKGIRKWSALVRICLHQTAFTWKPYRELKAANKWSSHHKINAHLCFDTDGSILLIHNFMYYLWTANSYNPSVLGSWEIMGNFEGIQGTGNWYKPDKFGRGRPTRLQLLRVRQMLFWILNPEEGPSDDAMPIALREWRRAARDLGYNPVKWINAHRQSTDDRELDCGSECWYHVGRWAVEALSGLSLGPVAGKGLELPAEWEERPETPPVIA